MTNIEGQPERRNVIVTSLAVIVYFLADGHFDSGLKIAIINIKFYDETALIIFFWVMFLWFGLRYWQVNKTISLREINQELPNVLHSKIHKYIVCKIANFPEAVYESKKYYLEFHTQNKEWAVRNKKGTTRYTLTKKEKSLVWILMYFYYTIYGDSINKHVVPYLLFYIALLMGINYLFGISFLFFIPISMLLLIEFLYYIKE